MVILVLVLVLDDKLGHLGGSRSLRPIPFIR